MLLSKIKCKRIIKKIFFISGVCHEHWEYWGNHRLPFYKGRLVPTGRPYWVFQLWRSDIYIIVENFISTTPSATPV